MKRIMTLLATSILMVSGFGFAREDFIFVIQGDGISFKSAVKTPHLEKLATSVTIDLAENEVEIISSDSESVSYVTLSKTLLGHYVFRFRGVPFEIHRDKSGEGFFIIDGATVLVGDFPSTPCSGQRSKCL